MQTCPNCEGYGVVEVKVASKIVETECYMCEGNRFIRDEDEVKKWEMQSEAWKTV